MTSAVPSVSDGTAGSSDSIPMSWAALTTFSGPTSRISCANTTLIESCVAPHRLSYPASPAPSAFDTHEQSFPLHSGRNNGDFVEKTEPGGIPSRNAATRVNGLNDDPGCRRASARFT